MSNIIAIVNQKGGVGKTTTAVNLGAYLAHNGQSVLLLDFDPQANATSGLGIDHRTLTHGIYEALLGIVDPASIVQETAHQNYAIIPATRALAGANVDLVTLENRERKLADAFSVLTAQYDITLIDCPPSLGMLTINALAAAHHILIPVQAEYYALEGLGQLIETIRLIQERLNPDLNVLGAVLTMYDRRQRLSQEVLEELYRHFENKIFRSVIPRSVRLAESPSH